MSRNIGNQNNQYTFVVGETVQSTVKVRYLFSDFIIEPSVLKANITIKKPNGIILKYSTDNNEITNISVNGEPEHYINFITDIAGQWHVRWDIKDTSGNISGVSEDTFLVTHSNVI